MNLTVTKSKLKWISGSNPDMIKCRNTWLFFFVNIINLVTCDFLHSDFSGIFCIVFLKLFQSFLPQHNVCFKNIGLNLLSLIINFCSRTGEGKVRIFFTDRFVDSNICFCTVCNAYFVFCHRMEKTSWLGMTVCLDMQ